MQGALTVGRAHPGRRCASNKPRHSKRDPLNPGQSLPDVR